MRILSWTAPVAIFLCLTCSGPTKAHLGHWVCEKGSGYGSDLMRRMAKEKLLKFDGTPLFPERIAHPVPYAWKALWMEGIVLLPKRMSTPGLNRSYERMPRYQAGWF